MNKSADISRIYMPPDANCLLSVTDHCLKSYNYVNVIVSDKQKHLQYLTMEQRSSTARKAWASGSRRATTKASSRTS